MGIGISDADKPHIFERFYRAEKDRSDKNHSVKSRSDYYKYEKSHSEYHHCGIGLAIAYEIIAAHNGSITVSNNQEHEFGTVFTVILP